MSNQKHDDEIARLGRDWMRKTSDELNAPDRVALNRARQRALEQLSSRSLRPKLAWTLVGASAAAILAAVLVLRSPSIAPLEPQSELIANSASDDFELLMGSDELEMFEELEFFELLDLVETETFNGAG